MDSRPAPSGTAASSAFRRSSRSTHTAGVSRGCATPMSRRKCWSSRTRKSGRAKNASRVSCARAGGSIPSSARVYSPSRSFPSGTSPRSPVRSRRRSSGKACAGWIRCLRTTGKFSNVQAAIGLAGLKRLPEFIERTRRHARVYDEMLGDVPGVTIPHTPEGRNHVYYQYCPYVPDYLDLVRRCIRRGVDVAPMHVDHSTTMDLFDWTGPVSPGAAKAMTAVQMPVYESLSDAEIERIGRLVRKHAQQAPQQIKKR